MTLPLPSPNLEVEGDLLAHFFLKMKEWDWHRAFSALDDKTALVVDADVQCVLEHCYGKLKCQFVAPRDVSDISADTKHIYVLCLKGEWALARCLRSKYAGAQVISLMYDVAPLGALADAKLPTSPYSGPATLAAPKTLLLTQQGADFEYLSLLLAGQGCRLANMCNPALASWFSAAEDFQVLRFVSRLVGHAHSADGLILDLRFLTEITRCANIPAREVTDWLRAGETRVVYFISRDRARQVSVNQALSAYPFNSFWDRNADRIAAMEYGDVSQEHMMARLMDVIALEVFWEPHIAEIEAVKMVTLEELAAMPQAALNAVLGFWGKKPKKSSEIPWQDRYSNAQNFLTMYRDFRAAIAGMTAT
jgi:hypothetical protein